MTGVPSRERDSLPCPACPWPVEERAQKVVPVCSEDYLPAHTGNWLLPLIAGHLGPNALSLPTVLPIYKNASPTVPSQM